MGWQIRPEFAAAVNTVYMYAPTPDSPPPLEVDHGGDAGELIRCTESVCIVNSDKLDADNAETRYHAALTAVLKGYGVTQPKTTNAKLAPADFAGLGVPSRACTSDADCGTANNGRSTCCDATAAVPGICCSAVRINLHDAVVSPALVIIFLTGAGLLSLYWTILYCRRLHAE